MKKHHFILISSIAFILLFYKEDIGLNLALFGLALVSMIGYFFKDRVRGYPEQFLVATSIFSCVAFAWYGDFVSFVALALSILFLQFRIQSPELKMIQALPIVFINSFASSVRFFQFSKWLPDTKINANFVKIIVAYFVIPMVFLSLFFIVYSLGSAHFSSLFTDYTLDFNPYQFVFVVLFGIYFSFSFWNYWVPEICVELNPKLNDEIMIENQKSSVKSYSLLDSDFKRRSGEITFLLLNLLLVVFIVTFNYEQFFESIATSKLSAATHERVNAVVFSIFMSIVVVLLYFKGEFNFEPKAKSIKMLAKVWILLNSILILSTLVINSEYISFFGLTYKRLGVFAFLILATLSLFFTFIKIARQKSNAYLFNQMIGYCYGMILLCSFINWGNLITIYNISVKKGIDPIFLSELNFNDEVRRNYFLENKLDGAYSEVLKEEEIKYKLTNSFLSKALYYESLKEK